MSTSYTEVISLKNKNLFDIYHQRNITEMLRIKEVQILHSRGNCLPENVVVEIKGEKCKSFQNITVGACSGTCVSFKLPPAQVHCKRQCETEKFVKRDFFCGDELVLSYNHAISCKCGKLICSKI